MTHTKQKPESLIPMHFLVSHGVSVCVLDPLNKSLSRNLDCK